MKEEDIRRDLEAAGCDENTIECFCSCERKKQFALLSENRRRLLEKVHEEESRISRIDYLTYRLEKERE